MQRACLLYILVFCLPISLLAQGAKDSTTTTNKDSIKVQPTVVAASLSADGNYQQGNVNRILLALRTEGSVKNDDVEIESAASYVYGEQNKQAAENDGMLTLNTVVSPHTTVGWLTFGTTEFSRLRNIRLRWQLGSGIKTTLLSHENHTLKLSGVALFDVTEYPDTIRRGYRFSLRLKGKHTIIPNRLRFLHESFFQPSFLDVTDLRCRTTLIVEFPLSATISLRTTLNDSYESVVQSGRKNNDMQWTFGINVRL